jgi:hypothetical protein
MPSTRAASSRSAATAALLSLFQSAGRVTAQALLVGAGEAELARSNMPADVGGGTQAVMQCPAAGTTTQRGADARTTSARAPCADPLLPPREDQAPGATRGLRSLLSQGVTERSAQGWQGRAPRSRPSGCSDAYEAVRGEAAAGAEHRSNASRQRRSRACPGGPAATGAPTAVDNGKPLSEPDGVGRRVRLQLLPEPGAGDDDARVAVPAQQDAETAGLQVERAGVAPAGERVPRDDELVLPALQRFARCQRRRCPRGGRGRRRPRRLPRRPGRAGRGASRRRRCRTARAA